jgi:hypothetical protein
MQRIVSPVRRLTMQAFRLALVPTALRLSDLGFQASIKLTRCESLTIAGDGRVL